MAIVLYAIASGCFVLCFCLTQNTLPEYGEVCKDCGYDRISGDFPYEEGRTPCWKELETREGIVGPKRCRFPVVGEFVVFGTEQKVIKCESHEEAMLLSSDIQECEKRIKETDKAIEDYYRRNRGTPASEDYGCWRAL